LLVWAVGGEVGTFESGSVKRIGTKRRAVSLLDIQLSGRIRGGAGESGFHHRTPFRDMGGFWLKAGVRGGVSG